MMRDHYLVDRHIDPHEICVRCLLQPLMLKKNKLDTPAVLPPKNKKEVSLLRLKYTEESFCIKHGQSLSIANNTFCGLTYITQSIIAKVNEWAMSEESKLEGIAGVNGIHAELIGTPMLSPDEYVPLTQDVYLDDDIYLPMHCDLVYSEESNDDVKTRIRAYARQLIRRIKYNLLDENGKWKGWEQESAFEESDKD